jgi:cellulose synthase/poly-beta-1,6-N-acetylglucosamine synthase-like glycosyltransferase
MPASFYFLFLLQIRRGIKIVKSEKLNGNTDSNSVSIIIPFRNESKNLERLVNCLVKLEFEGSCPEIILVNDHSTDDWEGIKELTNNYEHIKIITQSLDKRGKKNSITLGVESARGEIILISDADCIIPPKWMVLMLQKFDENTGFVAGAVRYSKGKTIFEKIQALEYGGLILSGAGLIGLGKPTICSAASIAFKKNIFSELNGYDENIHLASGDDEFLMRSINKLGYKVQYLLDEEAIVETSPSENIESFLYQRNRWASKSLYYENFSLIFQLFIIFIFYASLLLMTLCIFYFGVSVFFLFLITFLLKILTEYIVLKEGESLLFEKIRLSHLIIAEIFQLPYIVYSSVMGVFGGFNWKDREYKR